MLSKILVACAMLLVLVGIPITNKIMISQSPIATYTEGTITLNMVIFWGAWGFISDWLGKRRGWAKNDKRTWALFIVGLILIFAAFRLSGLETIFG